MMQQHVHLLFSQALSHHTVMKQKSTLMLIPHSVPLRSLPCKSVTSGIESPVITCPIAALHSLLAQQVLNKYINWILFFSVKEQDTISRPEWKAQECEGSNGTGLLTHNTTRRVGHDWQWSERDLGHSALYVCQILVLNAVQCCGWALLVMTMRWIRLISHLAEWAPPCSVRTPPHHHHRCCSLVSQMNQAIKQPPLFYARCALGTFMLILQRSISGWASF